MINEIQRRISASYNNTVLCSIPVPATIICLAASTPGMNGFDETGPFTMQPERPKAMEQDRCRAAVLGQNRPSLALAVHHAASTSE